MVHINTHGMPGRPFRLAAKLIRAQSKVPKSPVGVDANGSIVLCAAACLAYAGLQDAFSREVADNFALHLAKTKSFIEVKQAFEKLQWPIAVCNGYFDLNDGTPEQIRQNVIAQEFEKSADISSIN